jgi:hypothetical protein
MPKLKRWIISLLQRFVPFQTSKNGKNFLKNAKKRVEATGPTVISAGIGKGETADGNIKE